MNVNGAALLAGALVGLAFGERVPRAARAWSKHLLAIALVGLGASMDLRAVARAGANGIGYTMLGIAACGLVGLALARLLRVEARTALLITIGTAICGGSAIAAVAPVIKPKDDELAVALATVFVLNGIALFVFPLVGHAVGLDQDRFGLWTALAVHDTSSVVGAAMSYGARALEVATTVKLARALWIVPVTLVLARVTKSDARPTPPWFLAGFLVSAAVVTFVPALRPLGHVVAGAAHHLLAVTLFLIGTGITRPALRAVGARPLLHGFALWAIVATGSLAAVAFGS